MAYSPLRTGDPTIDRNLDAIKAALDQLSKSQPSTAKLETYWLPIKGSISDPSKGVVIKDLASFWVMQNLMTLRYDYNQSVGGGAGNGVYIYSLPPGYEFDPNYMYTGSAKGQGVLGPAEIQDGGAAYNGVVLTYSPNSMTLKMQDPTAASGVLFDVGSANAPLSSNNLSYSFVATFPVRKV